MGKHIIEEAKRCLQCKKPQCKEGCPIKTPFNDVVKMFLEGNIVTAGETLFKNNPLSVVCSLICPHEANCEGHCILNKKGSPVHVSTIEHYISDYYLNIFNIKPRINPANKVAIIGSGPAGIAVAFILAQKGFDITIYEGHDRIGGVLRYGIPEFRLPKSILERLKEKLLLLNVKIRPNIIIGQTITIDHLFRDGFKAIFIGTGVWKPRSLGIKGESLGHVHYAIDYLKNPDVYNLGEKVCILGAGNVAIDVARTVLRNGVREATIMYRKNPEDMRASRHEIDYAKIDGVRFEYNKTPTEILEKGVKYIDTGATEAADTESIFAADSVIIAISQGPRTSVFSNNLSLNSQGLVVTDDCGRTNLPGIFASGDVVTGAKTVVEAVEFSKKVAKAIEKYILTGKSEKGMACAEENPAEN